MLRSLRCESRVGMGEIKTGFAGGAPLLDRNGT